MSRPYVKRGLHGLASVYASRLAYLTKPERVCPRCKVLKPVSAYQRKPDSQPSPYCKPCVKASRIDWGVTEYGRRYCAKHRDRLLARRKITDTAYRDLRRKLVDDAKNRPCADCGTRYPAFVMDFDHRDPSTKLFAVARVTRQHTRLEDIAAEIAKCDVVCSNCHRYRTNMQLRAKYPHLVHGRG